MAIEFTDAPVINHGKKNADGSSRRYCPGCWFIMGAEEGDIGPTLYAVCNECGEIRDLSGPLQEPPQWPDILMENQDE